LLNRIQIENTAELTPERLFSLKSDIVAFHKIVERFYDAYQSAQLIDDHPHFAHTTFCYCAPEGSLWSGIADFYHHGDQLMVWMDLSPGTSINEQSWVPTSIP
jgi:hypothetical protein